MHALAYRRCGAGKRTPAAEPHSLGSRALNPRSRKTPISSGHSLLRTHPWPCGFRLSPSLWRQCTHVVGSQHFCPVGFAAPSSAVQPGGSSSSFPAQLTTAQLQGLRRFPSQAQPSSPHQAPPPEPGSSPSGSGFIGLQSSRVTRAAQHPHSKRATSKHAPELPSPHAPLGSLTPACSGLAALAADARR